MMWLQPNRYSEAPLYRGYLNLLPHPPFLQDELSLVGYRSHVEAAKAAPPLTKEEQELKEIKDAEVGTVHYSVKTSGLS